MTTEYDDVEACVDAILERLGDEIVVGAPLGLGKPNHILNELVERAVEDSDIDLTIWSALTLSAPDWDSDLERRLVEPLVDRVFGDYPELEYARLLGEGELPDNIEVHQFYYPPGEHVNNPRAQQHHHSVNYTHVVRAMKRADVDLLLQLLGVGELDGERYFNLGSNADVSNDLIDSLRAERAAGERDVMIVGQVNRNMPFMYGDAPVETETFDAVLDDPAYEFSLFGPPNMPVSTAEHAIALRVSSLLKDGGTLQIGIGSLGDAIGCATALRHHDNETYREALEALGVHEDCPDLVEEWGGVDTFEEGLYGATEMFVEAFLHLFEADVLTREVYHDLEIQRLVDEGRIDGTVDADTLDALLEAAVIDERLAASDVESLREWGVFREDVRYEPPDAGTEPPAGTAGESAQSDGGRGAGTLSVDGESIPADLSDPEVREAVVEHALGESLDGGTVLDAGFFLGSNGFYERIRQLDEDDRRKIAMRSVQFTNQLYGDEELTRLQRRDARFVNTGMKATVSGGVASDGLADNRVVSGVGGQFDFVDMAHELADGRSIVMIRATRESGGEVESNVVWNYGHITIPRHLRDIVVTEYGVADLRDKCDAEVITEMIKVADSRFQDDLAEKAKDAGKIADDWEVPVGYRNNYPEALEEKLAPYSEHLPQFPYGTEITEEERTLTEALRGLQSSFDSLPPRVDLRESLPKVIDIPEDAEPYLERMGLARPRTPREFLYKRVVAFALAESGAI